MNCCRPWKKFFILGIMLSAFFSAQAFAEDPLYPVADSVMDDIAARIAAYRFRYLVFTNFDPAAMSRNPDGFKELRYSYPLAEGRDLEVNVLMLSAKTREGDEMSGWRRLEFPLIGVKVLWATTRTGFYLDGFNLDPIVEDALWPLIEFQQKKLPLRMSIETPKTEYETGETVHLNLVVKNVSNNTLRVKPLNGKTLYCLINDQVWGTKEAKPAPSKSVLRAGEELGFPLKLKGISVPGDLRIICSYGIGYQGVRPQGRKVLRIERKSINNN